MVILDGAGDPPPLAAIEQAADHVRHGRIVAIPTDTVYGLAADPFRPDATDRIFAAKGRPPSVNLPILVSGIEQALALATAVPASAVALLERFWPGPLTVVLPSRPDLGAHLGDDDATVGVRCPAHPVPRALCTLVGPLATTSANRHGEPTLTTASSVAETFGASVGVVLDAGPCAGRPSTVVDCTGQEPKLLRDGPVRWDDIRSVLG